MARLQILELPEGASDDRPPFVLIVDQYEPQRYIISPNQPEPMDQFAGIAEKIGARAVLVFEEAIEIPANDVPIDADGSPLFGQDVRALDGPRLGAERSDIARDMDRLAKWKNELSEALGMDRARDWDDIRNAAAGIRKDRVAQAAELERLRTADQVRRMGAQ